MILVTSSRKPAQRVRRLCRDLAFAVGGEYRPRGKAGLAASFFSRGTVLILGSRGPHLGLQVLSGGDLVADLPLCSVEEERRAVLLRKGVQVQDPGLFAVLFPLLPAVAVPEAAPGSLTFDGIQGRTVRMVVCP